MEILLITDTYLSSVPFGGEVIKTNNGNPSGGESKQDQGERSSQEKLLYVTKPGLAAGNRASLKSGCVDHQLTCFVSRLILSSRYMTFPTLFGDSVIVWVVWPEVSKNESTIYVMRTCRTLPCVRGQRSPHPVHNQSPSESVSLKYRHWLVNLLNQKQLIENV